MRSSTAEVAGNPEVLKIEVLLGATLQAVSFGIAAAVCDAVASLETALYTKPA
jgi:hypothetical protein